MLNITVNGSKHEAEAGRLALWSIMVNKQGQYCVPPMGELWVYYVYSSTIGTYMYT